MANVIYMRNNMIAIIKPQVKLYVSPSLLRAWADQMEKGWPDISWGANVEFLTLESKDIDVTICYDQEAMHRDYPRS